MRISFRDSGYDSSNNFRSRAFRYEAIAKESPGLRPGSEESLSKNRIVWDGSFHKLPNPLRKKASLGIRGGIPNAVGKIPLPGRRLGRGRSRKPRPKEIGGLSSARVASAPTSTAGRASTRGCGSRQKFLIRIDDRIGTGGVILRKVQ